MNAQTDALIDGGEHGRAGDATVCRRSVPATNTSLISKLITKGKDMNIDDLTLKQIKEISALVGTKQNESSGLNCMIGKKVIIRTYSAGVWFGELSQKDRNEVILLNARRMWTWWAKEGISLSSVAVHGIKENKSKIAESVDCVWLEAIEIIPCSDKAILNIEGAPNAKAE